MLNKAGKVVPCHVDASGAPILSSRFTYIYKDGKHFRRYIDGTLTEVRDGELPTLEEKFQAVMNAVPDRAEEFVFNAKMTISLKHKLRVMVETPVNSWSTIPNYPYKKYSWWKIWLLPWKIKRDSQIKIQQKVFAEWIKEADEDYASALKLIAQFRVIDSWFEASGLTFPLE